MSIPSFLFMNDMSPCNESLCRSSSLACSNPQKGLGLGLSGVGRSPFELSRLIFCIMKFIILFAILTKKKKSMEVSVFNFFTFLYFSRKLICKEHFGFETDLFI